LSDKVLDLGCFRACNLCFFIRQGWCAASREAVQVHGAHQRRRSCARWNACVRTRLLIYYHVCCFEQFLFRLSDSRVVSCSAAVVGKAKSAGHTKVIELEVLTPGSDVSTVRLSLHFHILHPSLFSSGSPRSRLFPLRPRPRTRTKATKTRTKRPRMRLPTLVQRKATSLWRSRTSPSQKSTADDLVLFVSFARFLFL